MKGFAILASVAAILAVPLQAEFREVNITTLGMD